MKPSFLLPGSKLHVQSLLISKSRTLLGTLALTVLIAASVSGQPSWYDPVLQSGIEPGSPDFYQHQVSETSRPNDGFCTWFAFEDAMYYDHTVGFPNLYADNNANWINGMLTNFENIYATLPPFDAAAGIGFMTNYTASPAGRAGYALGANAIQNTAGGYSIYNALTTGLLAGSNVLINIAPGSNTNQWWSYHILDAVGFNAKTHSIVVMDPDNNQYGAYGIPGTPPNNYVPYNIGTTPNISSIIETGQWGQVGGPTNSLMQQYTVDANGNITDGIYAGTKISYLYDIGLVPEPSVAAIGLAAAITFGACRPRRRKGG